jgi:hypothetical protein
VTNDYLLDVSDTSIGSIFTPLKMELIEVFEMSVNNHLTTGSYTKESILQSQHAESLKSTLCSDHYYCHIYLKKYELKFMLI